MARDRALSPLRESLRQIVGGEHRINGDDLVVIAVQSDHAFHLAVAHAAFALALPARIELATLAQESPAPLRAKLAPMSCWNGQGAIFWRLSPSTVVREASDLERARSLHAQAHEHCFMSNSVNFPITVEATLSVAAPDAAATP